jgi:hypothetical protein
MRVDLRVVAHAAGGDAEAFDRPVQIMLPFGLRRSGRPSRSAASSIWMIAAPAASRSCTSSRIASAIWRQLVSRGWSSRTKDQLRMVTGPVSIPFIGRSV